MSRRLQRQIAKAQAPKPLSADEQIIHLKAAAYDRFALIDKCRAEVDQINARITELRGVPVVPPKKEDVRPDA